VYRYRHTGVTFKYFKSKKWFMGFELSDISDKLKEWFEAVKAWSIESWEEARQYFQACDQWEWVGWGGEALGLVLVLAALIFW
jgi:hypothetical protein